jgi:hypothetical protein
MFIVSWLFVLVFHWVRVISRLLHILPYYSGNTLWLFRWVIRYGADFHPYLPLSLRESMHDAPASSLLLVMVRASISAVTKQKFEVPQKWSPLEAAELT